MLFGSHPEFGFNLAMDGWDAPARMLANAAYWQAAHLDQARPRRVKRGNGIAQSYPAGSGLARIGKACAAITDALEGLQDCDKGEAAFLAEDHAMSAFGLSGREIWRRGLADFADITGRMQTAVSDGENLLERARQWVGQHPELQDDEVALLQEMVRALEEALHYRTPPEWQLDFGYEGVLQMLERAERMLRLAAKNIELEFEYDANPYAYFDSSPFQTGGRLLPGGEWRLPE